MIESVQILRAIAAIMVVLFHIIGSSASSWHVTFLQSGVDIFFVISGFIMMETTARRPVGGQQFLLHRIARIVPLYWLCTAIYILISTPPTFTEIFKSLFFIFYRNSITNDPNPILSAGWTLNYEMYFYFIFALLMRFSDRKKIIIMGSWFLVAAIPHHWLTRESPFLFRMTSPLPLEFLSGMLLSCNLSCIERIPSSIGLIIAFLAFMALGMSPVAYEPRVLFYGMPAIFVVAGALSADSLFKRRATAPLIFLGNASYSIYLTHIITLSAIHRLVPGLEDNLVAGIIIVNLIACCLTGIAVHIYVERPLTAAARSLVEGLGGPRRPQDASRL